MEEIAYPSKGFLRNVKAAIWRGAVIEIFVSSGWRKKILLKELPFLLNDRRDSKSKASWNSVFAMFVLIEFFTAYFYAKSGSYAVDYIDGEKLVIRLIPPQVY